MASKSSQLGSLEYATESAFAEDASSMSVTLRPTGTLDVSGLEYPSQDIGIVKQRPSEAAENVRMPMAGSFSYDIPLSGLGSTCAGAVPSSDLVTLLGHIVGASANGLATGDTATGGTASIPETTGASGVAAGALVHIGSIGDGRGGGQWVAAASHSSNDLTLLTAMPAAPNAGDIIYASKNVYPSETAGTYETIQSLRYRLMTAQQQYLCHGVYPTALELNGLSPGELPSAKITSGVARWSTVNATFPPSAAPQKHSPSPVVSGSFFMNAVGTATRATLTVRKFTMSLAWDNKPEMGPGGIGAYQSIIGCNRGPAKVTISIVVDSEAAGTDTFGDLFDTDENTRLRRHALYSMSCADGRSLALYFPNLKFIGKVRQTQMNDDGVNRKTLEFEATTGATTTTDLTASPWRMGFA